MTKRQPQDKKSSPGRQFRLYIPIGDRRRRQLHNLIERDREFLNLPESRAGLKAFEIGLRFFMRRLPYIGRIARVIKQHPQLQDLGLMDAWVEMAVRGLQMFEAEIFQELESSSSAQDKTVQDLLQEKIAISSIDEIAKRRGLQVWDVEQFLEGSLPSELVIDVLCAIAPEINMREEDVIELWRSQNPDSEEHHHHSDHQHKAGNGV